MYICIYFFYIFINDVIIIIGDIMKDQKEFLESEVIFYDLLKKYKENNKSVNTNNEELKESLAFQENFYNKCIDGKKEHVKKQRKHLKIVDYKKLMRGMIIIALAFGLVTIGGIKLTDKIIRDYNVNAANDYMRTKIVTYLEDSDLDYSVLKDKIIFENDGEKIRGFVDSLIKDGFSRDEVIYMVSQICSQKEFDNVVKAYGYNDSQEFLDDNYITGTLSDNGNTYLQKWGDIDVFENNMEVSYLESVNDLMQSEKNKGLNR